MKNAKKLLALLLAVIMCAAVLAPAAAADENTPLVVGYSPFNSKFSPFFSETAYDQDVQSITQIPLLTSDRTGAIIQKGIEGETIEYNGTPYTYYGPADLTITENEDGTVRPHHQPIAEQEEHHRPDAEIHQVFHNDVPRVLGPGKAGFHHSKAALHKKHENRADQKPNRHIHIHTPKKVTAKILRSPRGIFAVEKL